jgi:hypothetical protein
VPSQALARAMLEQHPEFFAPESPSAFSQNAEKEEQT